jgi:hypothetical protein
MINSTVGRVQYCCGAKIFGYIDQA